MERVGGRDLGAGVAAVLVEDAGEAPLLQLAQARDNAPSAVRALGARWIRVKTTKRAGHVSGPGACAVSRGGRRACRCAESGADLCAVHEQRALCGRSEHLEDETRPVSTGRGTRRVQLVRGGGGGGFRVATPAGPLCTAAAGAAAAAGDCAGPAARGEAPALADADAPAGDLAPRRERRRGDAKEGGEKGERIACAAQSGGRQGGHTTGGDVRGEGRGAST